MEYVYAALLIHKSGGKVDEASVTKVLEASGVSVDSAKVKSLVASLEGINIEEAISKATVAAPSAVSAPVASAPEEKEDKPEEKEDTGEAAAAGLGALFG